MEEAKFYMTSAVVPIRKEHGFEILGELILEMAVNSLALFNSVQTCHGRVALDKEEVKLHRHKHTTPAPVSKREPGHLGNPDPGTVRNYCGTTQQCATRSRARMLEKEGSNRHRRQRRNAHTRPMGEEPVAWPLWDSAYTGNFTEKYELCPS